MTFEDGNYQVNLGGQGVSYRRAFTVSGDTPGDIALPTISITGTVTESGSGEPLEGVTVQAQLGMTANVVFPVGVDSKLVLLPLSALAGERSQPAVWVVEPGSAQVKLRPVSVGQFREDGVTVTSGLNDGDIVVTAGVHKLRSGQVVRVTQAASTSAGTEAQAKN